MDQRYLSPKEASAKYGCSKRALRKWANEGKVRCYKVGCKHFYLESSFRRYVGLNEEEGEMEERYLSPKDMNEKYGLSQKKLRQMALAGDIKFFQVNKGGTRYYEENSFRQHVGLGPEGEDRNDISIFAHRQFMPLGG